MDRVLAFVYSLLATAGFVLVRNARDLEDTGFVVALLVAAAFAFALTAVSAALLRAGAVRAVLTGVVAFVLVPILYVGYLILFAISVCVIGDATCYS